MIRAALIGLGNIAWKYDANNPRSPFALSQAGALLRRPDVELAGGCSPDEGDRQGFSNWSGGLPVFSDAADMLDALHPDLVGVCSPTAMHFRQAAFCLEAGVRLMWLEKPPADNSSQLRALVDMASERGATVCVNYFRRYLPSYRNLRDCLRARTYGRCLNIRITYSPGLSRNGVHLLDQLFFLTGAEHYELLWTEHGGHPDCPSFAVLLSDGTIALGCGGAVPYHTNDLSVQCERAQLDILKGGKEIIVAESRENDIFPGFFDLHATAEHPLGKGGIENYMQTALDDLLESGAEYCQPQSNLHSALSAQSLLEDILMRAGE